MLAYLFFTTTKKTVHEAGPAENHVPKHNCYVRSNQKTVELSSRSQGKVPKQAPPGERSGFEARTSHSKCENVIPGSSHTSGKVVNMP